MEVLNSYIKDKNDISHNFRVVKSKLFNSTNKYVIVIDNEIVCLTSSIKRAHKILAYAQGFEVELSDGKIKSKIDKILEGMKE